MLTRSLVLAIALILISAALVIFQLKSPENQAPAAVEETQLVVTSLSEEQYTLVRDALDESDIINEVVSGRWEAWIAYFDVKYTAPLKDMVSQLKALDLGEFYLRPSDPINPKSVVLTFDIKR